MREVEVIEENIEELVTMLASHTHSVEWDVELMERLVREIQTNLRQLRRVRS